ncbi:MFS general substrate transporter [Dentipellis sp. KUC8613]|nr:MFS general substrate transporter [Dentipellis sp. KUC8613]
MASGSPQDFDPDRDLDWKQEPAAFCLDGKGQDDVFMPMPVASDFDPAPVPFETPLPTPSTEREVNLSRTGSDIEMSVLPLEPSDGDARNEVALAPVDGGWRAWSFLIASAVVEALVWSLPFAYGIILSAYLQEPKLASQPHATTLLPLVGTLSSGVIYCSGPFVYPFMSYYPHCRRYFMWLGTFLCFISLLVSSYVMKIVVLVILQGALYGFGGALVYAPCISFMSEWFVRRRGLANGILFTGSATGGLLMPFILPPLLHAYGPFVTLRILSIAILVLTIPCLFFIYPRLPETRVHGPGRRHEASTRHLWIRNWTWWVLLVANTVQGFGYFVPQLWLPSSAALGPLLIGALSDYFMPWPLALITAVLSSISTFVLWGAVGNVAGLLIFSATYGVVAGGWSTLWSGFVRTITKDDPAASMALYGFLMLSRGLGNVLCSPVSTRLANLSTAAATTHKKTGFAIEGGRFGKLITYVGVCYAGAAAIAFVGWMGERVIAKRQRAAAGGLAI